MSDPEPYRWERDYYNSYGNYGGFRFKDWCCGCPHLERQTGYWDCRHPERAGEIEKDGTLPPCYLDACPCVSMDAATEEEETEYLTDWEECDIPVLVIDEAENRKIADEILNRANGRRRHKGLPPFAGIAEWGAWKNSPQKGGDA